MGPKSSQADAMPNLQGGTQNALVIPMDAEAPYEPSSSLVDAENWLALGGGAVLLLVGASRRSTPGACLAVSAAPLLYRGFAGRWPAVLSGSPEPDTTRTVMGGAHGVHVRESIRLELPVADVYRSWRRLDNLPQFMTHLDRVTEGPDGRSLERIERGEIDPSFIITHRIGLDDAPAMYRTFRDKDDACIKVVMRPGSPARHEDDRSLSRS
jgi:hypothetical protein